MLIDTHCHLDADEFADRRDEAVAGALAVGVTQLVVPAVCARLFDATLAMRRRYGCLVAFGLHPLYCSEHLDDHLSLLEARLRLDQPVAVGEIGLDSWQGEDDLPRQEALLVEQLKLARRFDLPVILHLRRAQDRVLKYLRQVPVTGGIAHAFNGSFEQAQAFIRLGFKLGFGGAMTYEGSKRIRLLAASLPAESLVLETDAPDIRPAWAAGQPNQPANLARFAETLAALRQSTRQEVERISSRNALHALQIDERRLGHLHLPLQEGLEI